MAKQLQLRRGTSSEHATFTGAAGEVTVNTTTNGLVVHDGTTAGGHTVGIDFLVLLTLLILRLAIHGLNLLLLTFLLLELLLEVAAELAEEAMDQLVELWVVIKARLVLLLFKLLH